MPAAFTETNTSPGPISGMGMSCSSSGCPGSINLTAFKASSSPKVELFFGLADLLEAQVGEHNFHGPVAALAEGFSGFAERFLLLEAVAHQQTRDALIPQVAGDASIR